MDRLRLRRQGLCMMLIIIVRISRVLVIKVSFFVLFLVLLSSDTELFSGVFCLTFGSNVAHVFIFLLENGMVYQNFLSDKNVSKLNDLQDEHQQVTKILPT